MLSYSLGIDRRRVSGGVAVSGPIALLAVNGTTSGDRPYILNADGSFAQVDTSTQWVVSGKEDAVLWKRPDALVGLWYGGTGWMNSTSSATAQQKTTLNGSFTGVSDTSLPKFEASGASYVIVTCTTVGGDGGTIYRGIAHTGPLHIANINVSTDGGDTWSSNRATGISSTGPANGFVGCNGNFIALSHGTSAPGSPMGENRISLDAGVTFVSVNGFPSNVPGATTYTGANLPIAIEYDSANSRYIICGSVSPWGGSNFSSCTTKCWTVPTATPAAAWTERASACFGAAESAVSIFPYVLSASIAGTYIYVSVKRSSDTTAKLYRALLSDLTSWALVATFTDGVNTSGKTGASRVKTLSDGSLAIAIDSSGLWRSTDGGANWTRCGGAQVAKAIACVVPL